uniref:outer membrane protein assembly factor BamB family protein n=1 Tax=Longimycelium tulufanense TaxID=907463 RepID=UPI0027E4DF72|nr:PQQ-binding-like beta-propeller repeat protein [Longimycelium tulufanense]
MELKWAFAFLGKERNRGQPAVVGNMLYVGGSNGKLHALNAKTGAAKWTFDTGTVDGEPGWITNSPAVARGKVYFGDNRGYLYAVGQHTGRLVWAQRIESNPYTLVTSSPLVYGGRVFVGVSSHENALFDPEADRNHPCCTFRGHVNSLDAETGSLRWRYYTVPTPQPVGTWPSGATHYGPSGAGVWGSPVVDPATATVYVGTGQNYSGSGGDFDSLLALDAWSGEVRWKRKMTPADTWRLQCALSEDPGYCPSRRDGTNLDWDVSASPNLFRVDGRTLVGVGQKKGTYHVMDAATGDIVWQRQLSTPMPNGGLSGIEWGSSYDGERIYAATWFADPGTLFALDPATGEILWQTPNPVDGCSWGGAAEHPDKCALGHAPAPTTTPGLVYEGSYDGKMRIYAADTGKVLWQYDVVRDFITVNGVPGRGNDIAGGGGAVVANGMLYIKTGYWSPYPNDKGNLLLAFGLRD